MEREVQLYFLRPREHTLKDESLEMVESDMRQQTVRTVKHKKLLFNLGARG